MAITTERMVAVLEARFNQYERALARAQGNTNRSFTAIERRGKQLEQRLSRIGSGINVRGILGPLAAGASLRGAQQLVDSATRIENALKVAGLSGEELTRVYDRLFASAQRNAAPLESLVTLYGRAAIVQKELGVTSVELESFVDNVAVALRVAGTDAQSASGALLQLSQALGSGVVRAEEFSSILEGALPIAQAAAAGLEEAGGSVAKLRGLVVDGKVSSEAFFRAFEAGSAMLQDKVAGSELTVSQAFVRLQNVLIDTAGELNESSGATQRMSEALDELGQWISETDFSPLINGVMDFGSALVGVIDQIGDFAREAGKMVGANRVGEYLRGSRAAMQSSGSPSGRAAIDDVYVPPTQLPAISTPRTVSLDDYELPSDSKKKKGPKENSYQRELRQIQERTAAIQAETLAMAGLNPLIDDYGFALEKARAVQDLLTAAEREGLAITPELRASIENLAEGYANATVEAEKLAEAQDKARQTAEDMRDLGKEVLGGFISDLRNGTSAAEALSNALGRIADRLLDMTLNSLFSPGGGGPLSFLFGGGGRTDPWDGLRSFSGGGSTGMGSRSGGIDGQGGFPAILHPRETVIDHTKAGGGLGRSQRVELVVIGEEGPMFRPAIRAESQDVAVRVIGQNNKARQRLYDAGGIPR